MTDPNSFNTYTGADYGGLNVDDSQMDWLKSKKRDEPLIAAASGSSVPHIRQVFHRYNTDVSRQRAIPAFGTRTCRTDVSTIGRREANDPVFQALDENSPELHSLSEKRQLSFLPGLRNRQGWTYDRVREEYKERKVKERDNRFGLSLWTKIKTKVYCELYKDKLLGFVNSAERRLIFVILDLIVDFLFCILYMVEMQMSEVTGFSPHWLWVDRPTVVWYLMILLTCENIISRLAQILFTQTTRYSTIISLYTFLDVVTGAPVIVSLFIKHGQYLYVPYFLRSIVVVWRIKRAIRNVISINADRLYDPLLMKLIVLVAYIIIIVYNGMAAFQYFELMFANTNYNLIDSFYFTITTVSTVGYGDIVPKSIPAKFVVILLIVVVLTILPGLISGMLETLNQKHSGGGSYERIRDSNLIVICGVFDRIQSVRDILNGFLHQERQSTTTHLVFLGREKPTVQIKVLFNMPSYKNRVTYLHGSVLNTQDLKRASVETASAVFMLSDHNVADSIEEDENNTLRTWAIHVYAPHVPIYTYNHHPFTSAYQKRVVRQTISPQEFQQALIGHNCLYKGSATLILNLLYNSRPIDKYSEPWQAQYDDGSGNEIYSGLVNPIFVGKPFTFVSWYLFQEFQAILFAVSVYVKKSNSHHIVLNPGSHYLLGPKDICYYISQGPEEVNDISNLSQSQFETSLKHIEYLTPSERDLLMNPHVSSKYTACNRRSVIEKFPSFNSDIIIGQPPPRYEDLDTPLCHLLKYPIESAEKIILPDARRMTGHILICSGYSDPFRLICTLRAAHITSSEHRHIIILRSQPPTEDEVRILGVFPDVYFVIGDVRSEKDLLRAGILGCSRLIILRKQNVAQKHDEYVDTSVIMCNQLARRILKQHDACKYIMVELVEQENVKLLQATDKHCKDKFTKVFTHAGIYASGQVFVDCSIDHLFYLSYHNKAIMKLVKLLCGLRSQKDLALDTKLDITSSYLCYIKVPEKFVGMSYNSLYRELATEQGIIPLGLFRAPDLDLGNTTPFVFTNPVPAMLLKNDDLVYVLKVTFD
ncbi:hypothetical protein K493DRAFT_322074 [Basidiobolus meristosporus CBS 931.73]|uniref:Calcium-activated potassium channel BK alpha subunit domain-containing protein n=1 Tax=Basidiobolus meristosporus CBS 931.73 TaxID=1314790 RepID=A0A1Y1VR65_9FUNG|nr:hypothetical protein K493DRAFT_322074 [Basidiobolus meristosporus CBS 931.73]|eukprot:ORX63770.1 hypothetical protein K493DRAFT_322074 [Basidiobolus meristosporus CBS 931.73]